MMRDTPRTFVGSVVFLLDGPVGDDLAQEVHVGLARLAGIGGADLDPASGTLVVTARAPTDRTEVVAVLDRLGCRLRA